MDKTIEKVIALDLDDLDVKKLKGLENMYRVRKGDIRIIFCIENTVANILSIGRRDDNTYNI
jgi:mRNA-degrading endonuclease RelE of RelBE toxin-antitoxin system